jgi:5-methylcytosine-specific restriction endonuclease McrA
MINIKTTKEDTHLKSTSYQEIKRIFKNRCLINPAHKGTVIHHITPKSHKSSDVENEENKVLLCAECHNLIHSEGSAVWKDKLIKLRKEWIEKYSG